VGYQSEQPSFCVEASLVSSKRCQSRKPNHGNKIYILLNKNLAYALQPLKGHIKFTIFTGCARYELEKFWKDSLIE
jgi:hypothetical protein